jgi:hypothetical protein
MPYLLGAPFQGGFNADKILDVDFSGFATGFMSVSTLRSQIFKAPNKSDLTFSRNYAPGGVVYSGGNGAKGETVQVSDQAIKASALSRQDDIACIGNRTATASKTGLVIQNSKWNFIRGAADPRDRTTWTTGTGSATTTHPGGDSPDGGTGCTLEDVLSNGTGNYTDGVPAGSTNFMFCYSVWQKGTTEMWMAVYNNTPGNTAYIGLTGSSSSWVPVSVTNQASGGERLGTIDGRAWPAVTSAKPRTTLSDYAQLEGGSWRSEAIPTPNSVRPYDRLTYATGSALVASTNQLKFYARFTPKFASTDNVSFMPNIGSQGNQLRWYLWSYNADSAHFAYIDASTKKINVECGITTGQISTTNAIAWSQYDEVEIYLAVGGGVASKAKYRLNGGSWTDLVLGTIADTPAPSGAISFFFNDSSTESGTTGPIQATAVLPCWLHHLAFYKGASQPAGV